MDIAFLGGMEVSAKGDLANWIIPGKYVVGMGGGMDIASSVKRIVVAMDLYDKNGKSKLKRELTLPSTCHKCVSTLITQEGVFEFKDGKVFLKEISENSSY